MKKLIAALVLCLSAACVTSGAQDGAIVVAGLALYSQIARDAQGGELGAKQLWCDSLSLTKAQLDIWRDRPVTDDALVGELTPKVHELGRTKGFRLHPIQIKQVILDSRRVVESREAYAQENKGCA